MSNNIFFERGQMADKPNNYLWNGDCLDLMKDIPDKSMDAIICDLPYGTTRAKWDSVIPFEPLWAQYKRIVKDNGAIVLFGSQPFTSALLMSNINMFKYSLVWNKRMKVGMLNCKRMPLRKHEDILLFYKNQCTYNPQMTKGKFRNKKIQRTKDFEVYGQVEPVDSFNDLYYPDSILEFSNANQKDKVHTTQKPLELLKYLVKTYTNENDWVLDNTCGSNTTGIACYDLNRNYIGIEKDIDIYNVAKERVEKNILLRANEQQSLFKDKP